MVDSRRIARTFRLTLNPFDPINSNLYSMTVFLVLRVYPRVYGVEGVWMSLIKGLDFLNIIFSPSKKFSLICFTCYFFQILEFDDLVINIIFLSIALLLVNAILYDLTALLKNFKMRNCEHVIIEWRL